VSPTWSEVVGLVPERALFDTAARHIQLRNFTPDLVLERKVRSAVTGGESLSGFVSSVASSTPTPGGGSVAAHVGSLAAAVAQMVAGLTIGKKKYVAVEGEMKEIALGAADLVNTLTALVKADSDAYTAVSSAYKLPKEPADAAVRRSEAITEALLGASRVPLDTARACARVAELAAAVGTKGNSNAVSDAGVAALLAEAACRGAAYNVRINVAALEDKSRGAPLVAEATELVRQTSALAETTIAAVEAAM
jgi:glutamate formiminotransferase/formiminotetrahydrofolate cyclodeaminase